MKQAYYMKLENHEHVMIFLIKDGEEYYMYENQTIYFNLINSMEFILNPKNKYWLINEIPSCELNLLDEEQLKLFEEIVIDLEMNYLN